VPENKLVAISLRLIGISLNCLLFLVTGYLEGEAICAELAAAFPAALHLGSALRVDVAVCVAEK
jgi:hypothetical protein